MKRALLLSVLIFSIAAVRAENWAQWRGPNFNGSSPETGLPDNFDPEKKLNTAWVCDLPGASNGTPVVFDDKVFVTSNNKEGSELLGLCVDRKSGKILWQKTVVKVTPGKVSNTGKNTLASPSPVTDGKQVAFTYGTGDIVCYDVAGNQLWARNLPKDFGELTFLHGYSSTPLLYKDKLYVQVLRRDRLEAQNGPKADTKYDSYILCLDWKSGKDVFKAPRKSDAKNGECESYSSPIPYERAGRPEILICGSLWVSGHNPDNGKEYWHWGTLTPWLTGNVRSVSEPIATPEMIIASGPRSRPVFGIKAGGNGDISSSGKVWEFKDHDSAVGSPAFYDGFAYLMDCDKKRRLTCIEPTTGSVKWSGSLDAENDHVDFAASPAAADGKIYCMNERGNVVIVKSQEFKILARVMLDEGYTAASPVVAQGHVFFRTAKRLYCVGK
ncbi:MAG TPA: PQQ-binding-like beta-propeller repeat protein [Planctomycetota bacterium]|nr:PQQ-binding-like beta-propeller repeat protein [Planctomycetota bacterium]